MNLYFILFYFQSIPIKKEGAKLREIICQIIIVRIHKIAIINDKIVKVFPFNLYLWINIKLIIDNIIIIMGNINIGKIKIITKENL